MPDSSNNLERYYRIFSLIVNDPRAMPGKIASALGHSGRGRSPSTIVHHISMMYQKCISWEPRLTLKAYESALKTAYFCRRTASKGLYSMFRKLDSDKDVTYAFCLSSADFFIISRNDDLKIEKYGLSLVEKSTLYTPVFTIPRGWNLAMEEAFNNLLNSKFEKELLPRIVYDDLCWESVDWSIFEAMRGNIRKKFYPVARSIGSDPKTVKSHFYGRVLPSCVVLNYFFPKGYSSYQQAFLNVTTNYEKSFVDALTCLPCTTYIYVLEKSLVLGLFHDSIELLLSTIEKMEEKAIIDDYLLYCPLAYSR